MCKYHFTGIEGHRIANLAKQTAYRPAGQDGDEEDEKERNAQLDDYVLHKLFKKSGMFTDIHCTTEIPEPAPFLSLVQG